jgi:Bacterial SH3 domain
MKLACLSRFSRFLPVFLLLFASDFSIAADSTPLLTVREAGVALYSRQDEYSDRIATLQKGEALTPLAEAVGKETWYLVQTKQGLSGWVRAADVAVSERVKETFKEQNVSGSTWSAIDSKGRALEGTWTVDSGTAPDKASGSWTLRDPMVKLAASGTWAAQKFSTGWSGTWRASVEGQKTEHTGSWTADFPQARETRFAELFEAAARDAIRGVWSSGINSGSWSIRMAK